MRLQVRFTGQDQLARNTQAVEDILTSQLNRFEHRLKQVLLYIEDVNGPRGGVDKQCRCVLHLKHAQPIVIRDSDESLLAMIHRVSDRASHALSRQIDRQLKPRSTARAGDLPDSSAFIL